MLWSSMLPYILLLMVHWSFYSRSRHSLMVLMSHFGHLQGSSLGKSADFKGTYWKEIQIKASGTVNTPSAGLRFRSARPLKVSWGHTPERATWTWNFPVLLEIKVRSLLLIPFGSLAAGKHLGTSLTVTLLKIGQNSKTFMTRLFAFCIMSGTEELKILSNLKIHNS